MEPVIFRYSARELTFRDIEDIRQTVALHAGKGRSHSIFLAETIVDTDRFAGTCYKAANWGYMGHASKAHARVGRLQLSKS